MGDDCVLFKDGDVIVDYVDEIYIVFDDDYCVVLGDVVDDLYGF